MKTGAEPKKVVALVGLMAVAAIVYWTNSSSDAPVSSPAARPAADPAATVVPTLWIFGIHTQGLRVNVRPVFPRLITAVHPTAVRAEDAVGRLGASSAT